MIRVPASKIFFSIATLLISIFVVGEGRKVGHLKPIQTIDDVDLDDDFLFYNSDDSLITPLDDSRDLKEPEHIALDNLLTEIYSQKNHNDTEKCQLYKSRIQDVCLSQFAKRSRFRPDDLDLKTKDPIQEKNNAATPDYNRRPTLASPQQICCEFRLTYLRCLVSTVNSICPIGEFNDIYQRVSGLSEFCSRFFSKSSKKCKKRYRIHAKIQVESVATATEPNLPLTPMRK